MDIVLFSDREAVSDCIFYLQKKKIPIVYMVSHTLKQSNYTIKVRKNILEKDYKNSVLVSYYYGSLISKDVFTRFHQAVNFHPAPLPYYKGVKCGVHAILNKEKKFGVTCHTITERFDEGEILGALEFPLNKNETGYSLNLKSRNELFRLFERYIKRYVLGGKTPMYKKLNTGTYNLKSPTYFSNSDFEKLKCLDELNLASMSTKNILRALWHPKYKDVYYTYNGQKVFVEYEA